MILNIVNTTIYCKILCKMSSAHFMYCSPFIWGDQGGVVHKASQHLTDNTENVERLAKTLPSGILWVKKNRYSYLHTHMVALLSAALWGPSQYKRCYLTSLGISIIKIRCSDWHGNLDQLVWTIILAIFLYIAYVYEWIFHSSWWHFYPSEMCGRWFYSTSGWSHDCPIFPL